MEQANSLQRIIHETENSNSTQEEHKSRFRRLDDATYENTYQAHEQAAGNLAVRRLLELAADGDKAAEAEVGKRGDQFDDMLAALKNKRLLLDGGKTKNGAAWQGIGRWFPVERKHLTGVRKDIIKRVSERSFYILGGKDAGDPTVSSGCDDARHVSPSEVEKIWKASNAALGLVKGKRSLTTEDAEALIRKMIDRGDFDHGEL